MFHYKIMIADGLLTSVDSTNFGNRSFRLDDEATLNIIDMAFASAPTTTFESGLARAHRGELCRVAGRACARESERVGERLATLIGKQR